MGEVSRTGFNDRELVTCFANWIHDPGAESPASSTKILHLRCLGLQCCLRRPRLTRRWTRKIAAGTPATPQLSFPALQGSPLSNSPSKEEMHERPHSCRALVAREAHRELDSLRPQYRGTDSRQTAAHSFVCAGQHFRICALDLQRLRHCHLAHRHSACGRPWPTLRDRALCAARRRYPVAARRLAEGRTRAADC